MYISTSLSAGSSSDDEILNIIGIVRNPRPKNENYVGEVVPQYEQVFLEHFRISRNVFEELVEQFMSSQYFDPTVNGGNGRLTAEEHILCFLWFAGHQTSSFRDMVDRFNIIISSLFRIIKRTSQFLSDMTATKIKWPTEQEQQDIQEHFETKGFPGAIGVIDGSHIRIDKPSEDPADCYINRKGFYSIQIQVVCDHKKKIRDIFLGYPGAVHDSRVFRSSPLSATLPEKCGQDRYILGDSGYPCTRYLLCPYRDRGQLSAVQTHFNTTLSRSRYIIEHCFGQLKQKFRQLYRLKLRSIPRILHFIRACCVLHNAALHDNFEMDNLMDNEEPEHEFNLDEQEDRDGHAIRDHVAQLIYNLR